jgi:hypothetical protein
VSQAAAISMNDSRFAPAPGTAGPAKLASPPGASRLKPAISLARLEMKLSRRARILSAGLLMIATSFGLSMLVVAINSL